MDEKGAMKMTSTVDELLFKLLKPVKVLVVEDGDEAAKVDALQAHYDCIVDWAATALDMLQKVQQCTYDMVVVELDMPGALEALRCFKRLMPQVPVVAVVGSASAEVLEKATLIGPMVVAHKPLRDFDSIFAMFRMRVRAKEDAAYFSSRQRPLNAIQLA